VDYLTCAPFLDSHQVERSTYFFPKVIYYFSREVFYYYFPAGMFALACQKLSKLWARNSSQINGCFPGAASFINNRFMHSFTILSTESVFTFSPYPSPCIYGPASGRNWGNGSNQEPLRLDWTVAPLQPRMSSICLSMIGLRGQLEEPGSALMVMGMNKYTSE
jgi:hypothetical protein